MDYAWVNEIFASIQGEGPWIGERHIFIRFHGCDLSCNYCDTPASRPVIPGSFNRESCSVQLRRGEWKERERIPNPVSAVRLSELCSRLVVPGSTRTTLSLTGGEPLLQYEFLAAWLPQVKGKYRVYLETNGVHADAMSMVSGLVNTVSMDFKLPSATGLRPYWEEHERFLSAAAETSLFVKAVVTRSTREDDILVSARLIAAHDPSVPLVLQPASGMLSPEADMLVNFQDAALAVIQDVRIIPQAHKILNVP